VKKVFILLPIIGAPLAAVTALTGVHLMLTSSTPISIHLIDSAIISVPYPLNLPQMLIGAGLLALAFSRKFKRKGVYKSRSYE